jgi:hypothetical protein
MILRRRHSVADDVAENNANQKRMQRLSRDANRIAAGRCMATPGAG